MTDSPDTSLIPSEWDVPEAFRQRLGNRAGRQRVMQSEGHLLLVLHSPPQPDEDNRAARIFWRSPAGAWQPAGPIGAHPALDELLDEYKQSLDELDAAEDVAKNARDYFEVLRQLNPLVRTLNNLHNVLQEARQACREARELIHARDTSYALSRRAELLHKESQHGLDFEVARQAERQAESSHTMAISSHRLNILVAFFFPLATIAGIFGMNLSLGTEGWENQHAPWPLMVVVAIGLLLGGLLMLFVTLPIRRRPE